MSTKFKSVALRAFATAAALTLALTGFAPAAHAATSLPEAQNGVIALSENTTIKDFPEFNGALEIDLNGHTLEYDSDKTVELSGGKSLNVHSGTFIADDFNEGTLAAFKILSGSSISLDDVTFITDGSGLLPSGDAARVSVNDSKMYCGTYAVATNAATAENYGVIIELANSEFTTATGYANGDGDSAPVFTNIPCSLTMNNCVVNGSRQGLVVRGGTAVINDCQINLTATTGLVPSGVTGSGLYANSSMYLDSAWKSGNELPMAAVVLGDRSEKGATAYNYPTRVTMSGTTVKAPEGYTTVYAYSTNDGQRSTSLMYDDSCSLGVVVVPEGSCAVVGMPVAKIGNTSYLSLADAIENVKNGETIVMTSDVDNAEGIAVPSGKNFTVDFSGCTYTLAGPGEGSPNTETNGFQLLKDSNITFRNGVITTIENAPSNDIKRIIQNYANLTLENIQIETKGLAGSENYALSFNNGNVVFKGNTSINMSSPDKVAFDVCKFNAYPGCTVTFDESFTGSIGGKIIYDSTDASTHKLIIKGDGTFAGVEPAAGKESAANDGIEISAGTFSSAPAAEYLADGYTVEENGGKFTVVLSAGSAEDENVEGEVTIKPSTPSLKPSIKPQVGSQLAQSAVTAGQSLMENGTVEGMKVSDTKELAKIAEIVEKNKDATLETTLSFGLNLLEKAPADEEGLIEQGTASTEKASFLDISVVLNVAAVDKDGKALGSASSEVTELDAPLEITVSVLGADLSGSVRLARVHEGVLEFIPCTVDVSAGTITFTTDRFSTYVLLTSDSVEVTFESNGGAVIEKQTVKYGEKVSKPADPTRESYIFAGWYVDKDLTKAFDFEKALDPKTDEPAITLYAKWDKVAPVMHAVTFIPVVGGDEKIVVEVEDGAFVKLPKTPTYEGYAFAGWFLDKDLKQPFDSKKTAITNDLTLYGGWYKDGAEDLTTPEKPKGELPKTGDDSMLPIVLAGTVGVAAVATGIVLSRKKK